MVIHNLTTEQLRKLADAVGDGNHWPKLTDDPAVNYAVDCIVQFNFSDLVISEVGEAEPVYDENLYKEEIEASAKAFGPFEKR